MRWSTQKSLNAHLVLLDKDPRNTRKYKKLMCTDGEYDPYNYDRRGVKRGVYERLLREFMTQPQRFAVVEFDSETDPYVVYRGLKNTRKRCIEEGKLPGVYLVDVYKRGGLMWLAKNTAVRDTFDLDNLWWDYTCAEDSDRENMTIQNCTVADRRRLYYLRERDGEYFVRISYDKGTGEIRLSMK